MKNLLRNVWDAPASTLASAIIGGLGAIIASDFEMPKWILLSMVAISAFLAAFDGPNSTKKAAMPKSLSLLLLLGAASCFLTSCGVSFTEDGCILGQYTRDGQTYYAGPCVGPDTDGDGVGDINRVRVQWRNEGGNLIRATYGLQNPKVLIEYHVPPGAWLRWSSKSGVSIGPVPTEVQTAIEVEESTK